MLSLFYHFVMLFLFINRYVTPVIDLPSRSSILFSPQFSLSYNLPIISVSVLFTLSHLSTTKPCPLSWKTQNKEYLNSSTNDCSPNRNLVSVAVESTPCSSKRWISNLRSGMENVGPSRIQPCTTISNLTTGTTTKVYVLICSIT